VGEYPDPDVYAALVYGKGALFLDALRGEIGDEAFQAFLKSYFEQERYGFASGEEFQQVAEAACGCDLDELFDLWVWEGGEIPGL
jgi:aminopeptidase N